MNKVHMQGQGWIGTRPPDFLTGVSRGITCVLGVSNSVTPLFFPVAVIPPINQSINQSIPVAVLRFFLNALVGKLLPRWLLSSPARWQFCGCASDRVNGRIQKIFRKGLSRRVKFEHNVKLLHIF